MLPEITLTTWVINKKWAIQQQSSHSCIKQAPKKKLREEMDFFAPLLPLRPLLDFNPWSSILWIQAPLS